MKKSKTEKKPKTKPAAKKHLSEEHRQKISEACKGLVPWNKGKKTGVKPANAGKKWDPKTRTYIAPKGRKRSAKKEEAQ